ncbi:MAG: sugar phosphate isomerase/epimerase family protein [Balneolaceae bacterium]|nr:sugar phosphate isomerase/epimerase family protein [Balneolaceae bacterium]
MKRKEFIKLGSSALAFTSTFGLLATYNPNVKEKDLFFKISLAEWSLHNNLFDGKIDNLDFPAIAKNKFDINAVEYVNQFFKDKAKDTDYLDELNSRCNDLGVEQVLIMVDGEGGLAVNNDSERTRAIENHYKWVEAAEYLGCHSIRVNTRGDGTRSEQKKAAIDGLGRLATFAKDYNINVIVENHGGYSSDGEWLTDVMQQVDMENCGTLPDFGNFTISEGNEYNRYKGVEQMMPYAKGVSAKAMSFDEEGNEKTIDYERMLKIVKEAGYVGYIGIEYSGEISEFEGIHLTKRLLEKVGQEISS